MSGELLSKYVIDYTIETLEPLAIGGSDDAVKVLETDRKVIKNAKGIPFVPGSSIKGVIRASFNKLSTVLQKEFEIDTQHRNTDKSNSELVCDITPKEIQGEGKISIEFDDIGECVCDLCLFFGAKGYGAPLQFTDCCLELDIENNISLEKRTHVRINPDSDTAVRGGLFSAESVPRGVIFKGKIIYELKNFNSNAKNGKKNRDLELNQKKLLGFLVNLINEKEIYLGGMKSRGYGLCKFRIENISEYSIEKILKNEPPTKESPDKYVQLLKEEAH